MILDLRSLLRSGKQQTGFYFEYVPETELIEFPSLKIKLPIKIEGQITVLDLHSAYVEASINFSVSGECTRCLKPAENQYEFYVSEKVEANNEDGYSLKNDKVDLKEIIDEAIVINFPMNFLCKEDCKGLCSGCGVNLNDENCKCEK